MGAKQAELRDLADARIGSGTPATWYVGLSTAVSNPDGSGFVEPVGLNYARVAFANNATNWPAAQTVGGITFKRNGAKVTFGNPSGSWGQIVEWGLFTALTLGTPRWSNLLNQSITPKSGNTPVEFDVNLLELIFGGA